MERLAIYADGACKNNPGEMGIGFIVDIHNGKTYRYSKMIGHGTNNIAEYSAVILALEFLIKNNIQAEEVIFKSDSQLIVNQINGNWNVYDENLLSLNRKVKDLLDQSKENIANIKFQWVPREKNKEADKLANMAFEHS